MGEAANRAYTSRLPSHIDNIFTSFPVNCRLHVVCLPDPVSGLKTPPPGDLLTQEGSWVSCSQRTDSKESLTQGQVPLVSLPRPAKACIQSITGWLDGVECKGRQPNPQLGTPLKAAQELPGNGGDQLRPLLQLHPCQLLPLPSPATHTPHQHWLWRHFPISFLRKSPSPPLVSWELDGRQYKISAFERKRSDRWYRGGLDMEMQVTSVCNNPRVTGRGLGVGGGSTECPNKVTRFDIPWG